MTRHAKYIMTSPTMMSKLSKKEAELVVIPYVKFTEGKIILLPVVFDIIFEIFLTKLVNTLFLVSLKYCVLSFFLVE